MSNDFDTVTITVSMSRAQANALDKLCLRMGFSDCREHADSASETYDMVHGLDRVERALTAAGI